MKDYRDLSKEELVNLTEDQKDRYINIEIIKAGLIPLDPPTYEPELSSKLEPTIELYEVRNIVFEKNEDALAFMKMKVYTSDYIGDQLYYKTGSDYFGLKVIKSNRREDLNGTEDISIKNKQIKERNRRKTAEWDKYINEIKFINVELHNKINNARDFLNQVKELTSVFHKFIDLADQNYEVARKFFVSATNEKYDVEIMNNVLQSFDSEFLKKKIEDIV